MAAPQWFPVTSPRGEDPSTAMSMTFSGRWFPVTSPRGEDPGAGRNAGTGRGVSSHLPARGGSGAAPLLLRAVIVSSHLPARGGSSSGRLSWRHCTVSSHLPARGGSAVEGPTR